MKVSRSLVKKDSFFNRHHRIIPFSIFGLCMIMIGLFVYHIAILTDSLVTSQQSLTYIKNNNGELKKNLLSVQKELDALKGEDQVKINVDNKSKIAHIEDTYKMAVSIYENLLDLKPLVKDTQTMDNLFANSLTLLANQNYSSAAANLNTLNGIISTEQAKIAAANAPAVSATSLQNVPVNNSAPTSGFSRQSVTSDQGIYLVDIIAADLNTTRVIVDTASDTDCTNNCPVMPLADYVARNGAFAGINGTFFCPTEYPSCAGKTNTFDTLLMNKKKHYFNSDNNIYSIVPLVFFSGNTMGVRTASSNWGRDTGVDSVIAMQPLLVNGGNVVYSGGDGKFIQKGPRCFIGSKGTTVYIGVVYDATMEQGAHVLKALGLDTALNLDEGGSTALWNGGGYKAGPGRNIPNAILFVRK